jgi:hypothetical protein
MTVVGVPYALLGLAIIIRDDIIQPKDAEKWKVIHFVSKLPWYWWVIATLALMLIVTLEGAYRAVRKRHDEIDSLRVTVDETRRDAQSKLDVGDGSGRDEFIVLAGQLSQFLTARREDYNSQIDPVDEIIDDYRDSLEAATGFGRTRAKKRAAMKRTHDDFTLREYGERFSGRVIGAGRRLRELGVSDAETAHLVRYLFTIADVEAAISELEAASASLPASPISDVAALRQDNALLKNEVAELRAISEERHLDDDEQRAIADVVRKGLRDLWELNKASPSWTATDKEGPIYVQLYTMENDRETARYCADFVKAFKAGGLSVVLGEFLGTSGYEENEQFIGAVSILKGNPQNLVRPFVLAALQSAGISVNECDDWPRSLQSFNFGRGDQFLGRPTLIIGQRR